MVGSVHGLLGTLMYMLGILL